jgi:hypothetical protein
MKKIKRILAYSLCCASIVMVAAGSSQRDGGRFFQHIVKNGETVSLICIDYFGAYSPEHRSHILSDNPAVKNIDLIYPGQKLKLRSPQQAAPAADTARPLLEKSAAVTQGVVTYVEGDAVIVPKAKGAKQKLSSNTIVFPGDIIQTMANGKVEIIINRETVLRLRERTKLTLNKFRDLTTSGQATRAGFSIGSVWTKMKKFKDKADRFELELPTAVAGVHGTVYQTTVGGDTSAEVKVYDGEVAVSGKMAGEKDAAKQGLTEVSGPEEVAGPSEVSMEQWVQIVRDMQRIRIDKQGKPGNVEQFQKEPGDSWEQWNERRDERISQMFMENQE